jgi:hypothetical protein
MLSGASDDWKMRLLAAAVVLGVLAARLVASSALP